MTMEASLTAKPKSIVCDTGGTGSEDVQEGTTPSKIARRIQDNDWSPKRTKPRLLYLYSGPSRPDSVKHFAEGLGWEVTEVDIEATPSMDLLDADVWDGLLTKVEAGYYDAALASPPCGTFSVARSEQQGPRPLRRATGPELFGRRDLTVEEADDVKVGNILADRTAVCLAHFNEAEKPWVLEQPAPRTDSPSMISLPKFDELKNSKGVQSHVFSQCRLGQKFRKDTFLMGRVSFERWPGLCNHPSKEWIIPWNGKRSWGPHPPLRGRSQLMNGPQTCLGHTNLVDHISQKKLPTIQA